MNVTESKQPTHRVYAIRKLGTNKGYWTEIGAAWANRDGRGYSVKLNLIPIGEADIVIREVDADQDAERGAQ